MRKDARRIDAKNRSREYPRELDRVSNRQQMPRKRRKKAELMLRVRDVIQLAHQCTMQEREKQPVSNAVEQKKEIVTTCSRD